MCMYVCIIVGDGLGVCCVSVIVCMRIMYNGIRRDAHDCVFNIIRDSQVVGVHMFRYCVIDETGRYAVY